MAAIRLSRNRIAYYPASGEISLEYLATAASVPDDYRTASQCPDRFRSLDWLQDIAMGCRRVHELREPVGDLEVRGLDSRQADGV